MDRPCGMNSWILNSSFQNVLRYRLRLSDCFRLLNVLINYTGHYRTLNWLRHTPNGSVMRLTHVVNLGVELNPGPWHMHFYIILSHAYFKKLFLI